MTSHAAPSHGMYFFALLTLALCVPVKFIHFPSSSPLVLVTKQGRMLSLQDLRIRPDLSVNYLWRSRFAIPILLKAFPGSQLKTTVDFQPSLIKEIYPRLLQLQGSLELPFGPVPDSKLVEAQEHLTMTPDLVKLATDQSRLFYGEDRRFTDLVDRHGLLQVMKRLEEMVEQIEGLQGSHSAENLRQKLDSWANVTYQSVSLSASPFLEEIFWTPCSKYRSSLAKLDCWAAQMNHFSDSIQFEFAFKEHYSPPDYVTQVLQEVAKRPITVHHLGLDASRNLVKYTPLFADLALRHGHPDTFLDPAIHIGGLGTEEKEALAAKNALALIEYLSKVYERGQADQPMSTFLRRRMVALLMKDAGRSFGLEELALKRFINKQQLIDSQLLYNFRPKHFIYYHGLGLREPSFLEALFQARALEESRFGQKPLPANSQWTSAMPPSLDGWKQHPYMINFFVHWGTQMPDSSTRLHELDADELEDLYWASVKLGHSATSINRIARSLRSWMSWNSQVGLPTNSSLEDLLIHRESADILPRLALTIDPRVIIPLVRDHDNWNWVPQSYSFEADRELTKDHMIALLNRVIIMGDKNHHDLESLDRLVQDLQLNGTISQRAQSGLQWLVGMPQHPTLTSPILWYNLQTSQNLNHVSLTTLRNVLSEPGIVEELVLNSPRIAHIATDLANKLLKGLLKISNRHGILDNLAIRLATVWLPAAETDQEKLANYLGEMERLYFQKPACLPALDHQLQSYKDNVRFIMDRWRTMGKVITSPRLLSFKNQFAPVVPVAAPQEDEEGGRGGMKRRAPEELSVESQNQSNKKARTNPRENRNKSKMEEVEDI